MKKLYFREFHSRGIRGLALVLSGLLILAVSGCDPDKSDGKVLNNTVLPTDARLGLQCEEVGIFNEPCILDDKNNPFRTTLIKEFDTEGPDDQETKFDQAADLIPADSRYAKSRFYFWATALARRPDVGENQYLTAQALHELYTAGGGVNGGSVNAKEQALKAYQSVLDNYFGAAIFFGPFPDPNDPEKEVFIPFDLSQLTARDLVSPINFATLFPAPTPEESELLARTQLGEWGYTYVPPIAGDPDSLPTLIPINFVPDSL